MDINSTNLPINPSESPIHPQLAPDTTKKKMRFLPLILEALILLIIITSIAYYLSTQNNKIVSNQITATPSPTAIPKKTQVDITTWKTYINNKGNYSLKYPPNLTLLENQAASVDGVILKAKDAIELLPTGLRIKFETIEKNQTLNDYLIKNAWCLDITPEKGKSFILDGKQGLIFESTPCGPWGTTEIDVLNKGIIYIIEIENNESEARKILSTFHFTN